MAEAPEKDSKTEEATPRRLEEARRKGDVAKSADLPAFLSLAAAFGVLLSAGAWLSQGLAEALAPFVAAPHDLALTLTTGGAGDVAWTAIKAALPLLLAVLVAAAVAGLGGNVLQTGFLFAPEKLKPDWKKVSPAAGFGRLFGPEGLFQFAKSLAKVVVVGWVCWSVMKPHVGELESVARMEPAAILPFARDLLKALFYAVLAFLAFTAAVDFVFQKIRFAERMRMTKEEVKEDYKQTEGDPHIKGKLKQLRAEKAKKRMMANVPKATVVITNPTHFAVALRYVAGETAAPICVAKGVDSLALKIRAVAGEHGVPLIEDKPLARALYAAVDVDETIPREHFEAVAKVIGFVLGKKARSR